MAPKGHSRQASDGTRRITDGDRSGNRPRPGKHGLRRGAKRGGSARGARRWCYRDARGGATGAAPSGHPCGGGCAAGRARARCDGAGAIVFRPECSYGVCGRSWPRCGDAGSRAAWHCVHELHAAAGEGGCLWQWTGGQGSGCADGPGAARLTGAAHSRPRGRRAGGRDLPRKLRAAYSRIGRGDGMTLASRLARTDSTR
jgi:hypothetical protein